MTHVGIKSHTFISASIDDKSSLVHVASCHRRGHGDDDEVVVA